MGLTVFLLTVHSFLPPIQSQQDVMALCYY